MQNENCYKSKYIYIIVVSFIYLQYNTN